jgi:ribosomal protein S18 acetylase RimI-like enzyme
MRIRKLEPADSQRFETFLRGIPDEDRTFFKEDLADPGVLRALANEDRGLRLVALDGGGIVGYLRVLPGTGLSSHVGEMRLVVAPANRRSGVGRDLAKRALVDSVKELGLRKLYVEVVAEQEPAILMFKKLGFTPEAILRDHLRDRRGTTRDLLLLSHFVDDNWAGLTGLGLDREVS